MENKKRLFRHLKADELQIRPTDTQFKGKVSLLVYKDARVDMTVLDETFGPFNWTCDYKDLNGVTYCSVAIRDANGEWIQKWDAGTSENNFEQEKGTASDAFKRACFKFGLGRELYNIPRIRINCPDSYYINNKLSMSFSIKSIAFEDDRCTDLIIVDRNGIVVYDLKKNEISTSNRMDPPKYEPTTDGAKEFVRDEWKTADEDMKHRLSAFFTETMRRDGWVEKYGVEKCWHMFVKDLQGGGYVLIQDSSDPKKWSRVKTNANLPTLHNKGE